MNGAIDNFNDSHVFIEVRDPVTGRYFIQDPTYNVAHLALDGTLLDSQGLRELVLDHPGEHLSQTVGGTVYTYFRDTGVAMPSLEAQFDDFISVDALVTPWRIVSSDGTNALWQDFRNDSKLAVADDVELKALVANAKQTGLGFDATVQQLAAAYDLYGIEFVNTSASHGLVLVARATGGGDLSIDFDTLMVVAGGVDKHWNALAHGEPAGLPDIKYSDAFRMVGANGIEAYFGVDAALPQQPLQGLLDFSYPNGYDLFQVAMESTSIVKSTAIDSADRELWTNWTEYRTLDDGLLLKLDTLNDDATSYRAQYDPDNSQSWALRETLTDAQGRTLNDSLTADDGSQILHLYDVLETNPWSSIDRYFAVDGQLAKETIVQDDGLRVERVWDLENTATWMQMESVFDTSGILIGLTYLPDPVI